MVEDRDAGAGRSVVDSTAYFNRTTHYLDEHVNVVRNVSTVLAIAGFAFAARSIRMFSKFYTVADIPRHFIHKNVRLQGKVVGVQDHYLKVEHIPILHVRIPYLMQERKSTTIGVYLAGVQFEEGAAQWLKENVDSQAVFFKMLQVNSHEGLDCIVTVRRPGWRGLFSSMCVNEELVRHGLGKVAPIEGMQVGTMYVKLTKRLLRAELVAERKRRGIWTEPTILQRYKAKYGNVKEDVKVAAQRGKMAVVESGRAVTSPVSSLKRLWNYVLWKFRRE